jgi:hypothetical protein
MQTPNQRLQAIKLEMGAKGWTNGGEPGGFKLDQMGQTIDTAGSDQWVRDVEAAIDTVEAREALRELERRGVTNQALGGALHERRPGPDEARAFEQSFEAGVSRR